jgi:hypothetical protein
MTVGSTSRNGGEFEFKKISLSLERDLVPAENPVDAYRDIKALLERMVTEFQGPKPVARVQQDPKPAGTPIPAGNENRAVPPRPAASKLATLQERLGPRLQDLEITDGIDGLIVKPRRYLAGTWQQVNEIIRALGGRWESNGKQGAWRIPK